MPQLGTWFTWITQTGPLVVTLPGNVAIGSLWFPSVPLPATISCAINGISFLIFNSVASQMVPVPSGAISVTLSTSATGYTIYVFASSATFTPSIVA